MSRLLSLVFGEEEMSLMRILHVLVVMLLVLDAGCIDNRPDEGTAEQIEPLSCTIHAERTCDLGKVPEITVAITNQTNADFYLVGSLDKSACKMRYPYCYFEVIGPNGERAFQNSPGCSFANELREKDFVKVRPGGRFDPYQEIDDLGYFPYYGYLTSRTFQTVGEYRIRFVYSSTSEVIGEWFGNATDARLVSLFRQIPKVELRSNEIKVTVVKRNK